MKKRWQIAVLGAGTMGRGITQVFGGCGHRIFLHDPSPSALLAAQEKIQLASKEHDIHFIHDLDEAVRGAELIVECIPENIQLKIAIYQRIASVMNSDAIVASNTSSFSLEAMAGKVPFPDRLVIMHFFNPAAVIPLVELVGLPQTRESVLSELDELLRDCNKVPVVLKSDIPGFIANRLQAALLREALHLLQTGAATIDQIDTVVKEGIGLRWAINGPFEITDFGGLDVWLKVTEQLFPLLSQESEPPVLLQSLVQAGNLGVKSGRGFYEHLNNSTDSPSQEQLLGNILELRKP